MGLFVSEENWLNWLASRACSTNENSYLEPCVPLLEFNPIRKFLSIKAAGKKIIVCMNNRQVNLS